MKWVRPTKGPWAVRHRCPYCGRRRMWAEGATFCKPCNLELMADYRPPDNGEPNELTN